MPIDTLMAMRITDDDSYTSYRKEMTPLLKACGGRFVHDFRIAETLKTDADHRIDRVFVIRFPDLETRHAFFENPEYVAIRKRFFEPAVEAFTRLAQWETRD